jgi:hypothetical protein
MSPVGSTAVPAVVNMSASLIGCRPIALRHRRQNLAPRAHADSSRQRPFTEGEVGGDDDRGALVEAADEVEQELAAGLGEGQIALRDMRLIAVASTLPMHGQVKTRANLMHDVIPAEARWMHGIAVMPSEKSHSVVAGNPRPRCPKPAPRLHLRPKTRGLRPHQTRAHAALRHRGGDRTYESRGPSRPLLSQRSRRRCRQRHPQRRRLQPSPRSRLAEDHFARHPTRATPDLHNSASPQTGFLTGDLLTAASACEIYSNTAFVWVGNVRGCLNLLKVP